MAGLAKAGGGISVAVPEIAKAQLAAGLDAAIAFCDDGGELSDEARDAERAGVRLIPLKSRFSSLNPIGFSFDLVRGLSAAAREFDAVVVHLNWTFPVWFAAWTARRLGKPLVMMPHGSLAPVRLRISAWKKRLVGWLDRRALRGASAVWSTSEAEAADIAAFVPGVESVVFPLGIDLTKYGGAATKPDAAEKVLLAMSRISPVKGFELLAAAWGRKPPPGWKLVIAGPDDRGHTDRMRRLYAETCAAGSYEFRDAVYGADKYALLASASAFVLPTRNENWGIVVAEALASRLPVICTQGAPWSRIAECGAGWWSAVSAEGLRGAIDALAAMSAEERAAMGERGRRLAEAECGWDAVGARMAEWFEKLLKEK